MLNKILGFRKIAIGSVIILIGILMDLFAKGGLSNNLLYLLVSVGVGFMGANSVEHIANKPLSGAGYFNDVNTSPSDPIPHVMDVKSSLGIVQSNLQAQDAALKDSLSTIQAGLQFIVEFIKKNGR